MAEDESRKLRLEIGHVLFLDIVNYTKLLMDDQTRVVQELTDVVRKTQVACEADAAGQLQRLPTGDGMALVFSGSAEAPLDCALQISRQLRAQYPNLPVRMGIHSGPVHPVADVNERTNIAGAGINIAQRVMDCGDGGHILLSQRVADDLAHYAHWRHCLHPIGECEVKHGVMLPLVNVYGDDFGNSELPGKMKAATASRRSGRRRIFTLALAFAAVLIAAAAFYWKWQREEAAARGTDLANIPSKSIAVLPFENLSRDPDNAFFADGIQDEVLTHLAGIGDLKVISRTSVMQYRKNNQPRNLREIARQLAVATLLEGSVQRAENKVRVNVQLIDARTDSHLWAQSYDRELADVFAIQTEIAGAIADQLQAKLSPKEKASLQEQPTADVGAFEQYSRAKTLLLTTELNTAQQKNFFEAIDLLNAAVARDSGFHAAYCLLVDANDQVYAQAFDRSPARVAAAEAALKRAIELRPDAAETHLARGRHLYYALRDYHGALAELEIAGRTLKNDPRVFATIGYILRRQGEHEEGLRALEHAAALDPRNVFLLTQLALSHQLLRSYRAEAAVIDRCREIAPDDITLAGTRALIDLLGYARTEPLHAFVEAVRRERPDSIADVADYWMVSALAERDWAAAEQALKALGTNSLINDSPVTLTHHFAEGLLARAMHDEARAQKAFGAARVEQEEVLRKQSDYAPAFCLLGLIDAALGKRETALVESRRAIELMPIEKDSLGGQRLVVYYAMAAAWAGEKDLALQTLAEAAPKPGGSLIASYGVLKLLPFWDDLRGDPRFEQIVASFAPKE